MNRQQHQIIPLESLDEQTPSPQLHNSRTQAITFYVMKSSKFDLILCIWTWSNVCHHKPHMLHCIMKFTYQKYQVSQSSVCCLLMIQQCGLQQYWYSEGHLWINNNQYDTCFMHSTKMICHSTWPLPTDILHPVTLKFLLTRCNKHM